VAAQSAELQLRADEPAAVGHFPGNPIVPGAVLLREVLRIVVPGHAAAGCEISAARFYQPVRPGDRLTVRWDTEAAGDISFICSTCADPRSAGPRGADPRGADPRSADPRGADARGAGSTGAGSTAAGSTGAGERRVVTGTLRLRTR
jgi:hypothetical protein